MPTQERQGAVTTPTGATWRFGGTAGTALTGFSAGPAGTGYFTGDLDVISVMARKELDAAHIASHFHSNR